MVVAWNDDRDWAYPYAQLVGLDGPVNEPVQLSNAVVSRTRPELPSGPLLAANGLAIWISSGMQGVEGVAFQPILIDFTANPSTGTFPLEVEFIESAVPAGIANSRLWEFGDGSTSNSESPPHTYTQDGNYTVTLTLEHNGHSQSVRKTSAITVGTYFLDLQAEPLTVVADDSSTSVVTITLTSVGGLPVTNQAIELRSNPDDGVDINGDPASDYMPIGATDSNGVLVATLTSSIIGVKEIDARLAGTDTTSQLVEVTFIPGPADPDVSQVQVDPGSITADGSATSSATAWLYDQFGNPIPDKELRIQTDGSAITLTQTITRTDQQGRVQATLRSALAQYVTVTAVDVTDGLTLAQQPSLEFRADRANADHSDIDVAPRTVVANLIQTATISATLRDVRDNPLANRRIRLDVTGSNHTITPSIEQYADGAGQVIFQLASSRIEAKQLSLVDIETGA